MWTTCIITCIYPPEEIYRQLVPEEKRSIDSFKQLLRRLTKIVYHYVEDGIYKSISIPGKDYVDYETLVLQAETNSDGFVAIDDSKSPDTSPIQLYLPFADMEDNENM